MQKQTFHFLLLFVTLLSLALPTFAGPAQGHKLTVNVTDTSNKEPIVMGSVQIQPLGSNAVTDMDGKGGITPWQVKAKVNPELQNYSLSKGTSLGRAGILNMSAAQPRSPTTKARPDSTRSRVVSPTHATASPPTIRMR